ncbi:MAG TPA: MerR family transcriptional regulator [Acidimicrobiales bacterium]|nr:MerR family transcriptional regulator [Acidimicrobiales bacterium]
MEGKLRIGELSERHGLSTATVRYYERLGLLGEPERSNGGYRLFTSEDEARLRFILRGKALDLSLEEIGSLLEAWHTGQCGETRTRLRHLVAHKIREARDRSREAEAFADQLSHVYARLGEEMPDGDDCGCIPDLPLSPVSDLVAELARIEHAVCSCGGRLGTSEGCPCGCCGETTTSEGGDDMTDQLTTEEATPTASTCACCAPAQTAEATDRPDGTSASSCQCGSGDSSGCGPDCSCGS